ncbi:MAG: LCP family protein [Oscillospiraceae bacterium]|jgi:LCP family protein required for cell wall assembly|nr:LCP family protein [Oscillospiraceae bacterium]
MKLISSRGKNKGRHIQKDKKKSRFSGLSKKKKIIIIVSCFVGLVLLLSAGAFAIVRWEIQPFYDYFFKPGENVFAEQRNNTNTNVIIDFDPEDPEKPPLEPIVDTNNNNDDDVVVNERDVNKYTFLILGIDDFSNTDVIMVATFDATEHTLEIASIPRDTLVNVDWNLKKANSIHSMMQSRYRNEENREEKYMAATIEHFSDILGYNVDFWVTLNMRSFVALVNAVGPIEFDVPRGIKGVASGRQMLSGRRALEVIRQRELYASADIGRVNTQQRFMQAIVKKVLSNKNSINVLDMANIFVGNVKTNIQLNHLVWFGREFLKMNSDDINFFMMPGVVDNVQRQSYVTIIVDEWLDIINNRLSPLMLDITADDVSILTRDVDRKLFVTDDNWQGDSSWGASSLGPSSGSNRITPVPNNTG